MAVGTDTRSLAGDTDVSSTAESYCVSTRCVMPSLPRTKAVLPALRVTFTCGAALPVVEVLDESPPQPATTPTATARVVTPNATRVRLANDDLH